MWRSVIHGQEQRGHEKSERTWQSDVVRESVHTSPDGDVTAATACWSAAQ